MPSREREREREKEREIVTEKLEERSCFSFAFLAFLAFLCLCLPLLSLLSLLFLGFRMSCFRHFRQTCLDSASKRTKRKREKEVSLQDQVHENERDIHSFFDSLPDSSAYRYHEFLA